MMTHSCLWKKFSLDINTLLFWCWESRISNFMVHLVEIFILWECSVPKCVDPLPQELFTCTNQPNGPHTTTSTSTLVHIGFFAHMYECQVTFWTLVLPNVGIAHRLNPCSLIALSHKLSLEFMLHSVHIFVCLWKRLSLLWDVFAIW